MTDYSTYDDQLDLSQQAIEAALKQDWTQAIKLNSELLKLKKDNIGALNRLAFAYIKVKKLNEAKKTFRKVLELDPYNSIAEKNLSKLDNIGENADCADSKSVTSPLLFLEEPGKTKVVTCVNMAPKKVLSAVSCGQEVYLKAKNYCVEVRDIANNYLATLPDDLSFRLIKLMGADNQYQVFVKSVNKNTLVVFIKETKRGKKFADQPSFVSNIIYTPIIRKAVSDEEHVDVSKESGETEE